MDWAEKRQPVKPSHSNCAPLKSITRVEPDAMIVVSLRVSDLILPRPETGELSRIEQKRVLPRGHIHKGTGTRGAVTEQNQFCRHVDCCNRGTAGCSSSSRGAAGCSSSSRGAGGCCCNNTSGR